MELSEFVQKTIEQIMAGVKNSQEFAIELGGVVHPTTSVTQIDFDIAVTVSEVGTTQKGGGITVAGFKLGAMGESGTTNTTVSRVKFPLFVRFPNTVRQ